MPTFAAPDGTELAYDLLGRHGRDVPVAPLVVLPGGPMRDPAYLGDLGGLPLRRPLVVLHLRGTGRSAAPSDPATYRCDRQVADVEALREHLGLDRLALLGHSAGANLAVLHAAAHPDRVAELVLVTPSVRALGIEITGEARREIAAPRRGEPWFDRAWAALEATTSGRGREEDWAAITPFTYGRWDAAAQAHDAAGAGQAHDAAAAAFGSPGAFDPAATLSALRGVHAPALVLAGGVDVGAPPSVAAEVAGLFPAGRLVVQPGAGHFPWLDDPEAFVALVSPPA